MDKDLQTATKELCEILEPMNIKLEKWLLEHKKKFIEDGNPANLGLLVGNAYAVYILIDDLLNNAD
jgi:hypothetical protein